MYNLVSEVGCSWPKEIYTPMSKHKFFMRGHCLGKLAYHRVQSREEF